MRKYLFSNLWVEEKGANCTYTIGINNKKICDNVTEFQVSEGKILAAKIGEDVYVYRILYNEKNKKSSVKFENVLTKRGNLEILIVMVEGYMYLINSKCDIICAGRK